MLMKIEDDIWPSLASWMINQWSELKPPVIVQFLKKADAALKDFAGKESSIKNLEKSIRENLEASVTGYEVDHLSDQSGILSSVGYAMGKKMDLANAINAEKWISLPSEKISGEVGRVNMNFPSDVSWSIDVYSAGNKFVTNRSSSGKQKFEDVVPGYYTLKLNTVPVENVAIEKGKEIKLKVGFLNIVSGGHWELRNESKEKFYTSGNKPAKIALPVGIYQLNFDEKYYRIIVRDRVIVRFELQVPFSE
jgi:hypothetical protein